MIFIVESGGIGGYVRSHETRNLYETGGVLAGGKYVRNGRCLFIEIYLTGESVGWSDNCVTLTSPQTKSEPS
jgi:hypothetical protein